MHSYLKRKHQIIISLLFVAVGLAVLFFPELTIHLTIQPIDDYSKTLSKFLRIIIPLVLLWCATTILFFGNKKKN